jgi:hypothetical protein
MNLINQKLLECAEACEIFIDEASGKDPLHTKFLLLIKDCADICRLSIKILRNRSGIEYDFLKLCQELCLICADQGRNLWINQKLNQAIEACLLCAEACKEESASYSPMLINPI